MSSQRLTFFSRALPCIFSLAAANALGGCIGTVGTGENPVACTPGDRDCVCDSAQQCDAGLTCIADRCIALTRTSTPRTPGETSPEGGSEETPRTGATSTEGEPTRSTSEPDDHPSTPEPEPEPEPELPACKDQQHNFRETDIDCGGPVCPACTLMKACRVNVDCVSELCVDGQCAQCAQDSDCQQDNPCVQSRCENKVCVDQNQKDGAPCNDKNPCTAKDQCRAGACEGQDTLVLSDDFDKGGDGWRFITGNRHGRSQWEIGTAAASNCGDQSAGQDPAQDHTQKGGNGVAGVQIGGCHDRHASNAWDCIWSKDLDVSFFDTPVVFSFWRHLHSPGGNEGRRSGVLNRIVYRLDGSGKSSVIETGYSGTINDPDWLYRPYKVNPGRAQKIAFGICFQKHTRGPGFAGWSIDDAKVRQEGCLPRDAK